MYIHSQISNLGGRGGLFVCGMSPLRQEEGCSKKKKDERKEVNKTVNAISCSLFQTITPFKVVKPHRCCD